MYNGHQCESVSSLSTSQGYIMNHHLDYSGYRKFIESLRSWPPAPIPSTAKEASLEDPCSEQYREQAQEVCALALVLYGKPPSCYEPELVSSLGYPRPVPLDREGVRKRAGGGRAIRRKLTEGFSSEHLGLLGSWTPGFIRGLILSGGLWKDGRGISSWRVSNPEWRGGLVKSFREDGLPSFRVGEVCEWGKQEYISIGGLWLKEARGGEGGIDELAGVLGGGEGVEKEGESWLLIRGECLGILEAHGVSYHWFGRKLLVSPFWGAILRGRMPRCLGVWMSNFKKVGDCPLLPWVVWVACVGKRERRPPLPYMVHRYCLEGKSYKEVREEGVRKLGLGGMSVELTGEVVKWVV